MSFWESRTHRARKKHHCEYCGKVIEVGETYSRETGMYEGDFNDYCLCMRCRNVISYFKYDCSYELGEFADDLFNTDFLECPKCHRNNSRTYDFSQDMSSIKLECDNCDNVYIVDLSEQAIEKFFKRSKDNE